MISAATVLNVIPFPPNPKAKYAFGYFGSVQIKGNPSFVSANVPHESAIFKVKQDQLFRFTLEELNGKYSLYIDGVLVDSQRNERKFQTIGIVSAWFGGTSKAPWTMWCWMDIY